jgi:hypothetical protein
LEGKKYDIIEWKVRDMAGGRTGKRVKEEGSKEMMVLKKIMLILAILLCLIIPASGFVSNAPTVSGSVYGKQFTDINGHWAQKEITDWTSKGLAYGYDDGTFRPDNSITRAEFVTFLNRAFNLTQTADISFNDVSPSDWFYTDIQKAKAAGIVSGYEDNTFRPNNTITREEAMSIVVRLKKLPTVSNDYLSNFNDAYSVSDWAKDAVNTAVAYGLVSGYSDNTIGSGNSITRAEAIVILNRALRDLQIKPVPAPQSSKPDPATCSPDTVINIPDYNLSVCIRKALKKPTGDITAGDMQNLTSITNCQDCKSNSYLEIKDLSGLEYATNLQGLVLSFCPNIKSLKPLYEIKRSCLSLSLNNCNINDSNIRQLLPFKDSVKTFYLDVSNRRGVNNNEYANQITDLSIFSQFPNLYMLWIKGNPINYKDPKVYDDMCKLVLLKSEGGNGTWLDIEQDIIFAVGKDPYGRPIVYYYSR